MGLFCFQPSPLSPAQLARCRSGFSRECGGGCNGEYPGNLASRPGPFAGEPAPTSGGVEPQICADHRPPTTDHQKVGLFCFQPSPLSPAQLARCRSGFSRECGGGCHGEYPGNHASRPGPFAGEPAPSRGPMQEPCLAMGCAASPAISSGAFSDHQEKPPNTNALTCPSSPPKILS